jgi:2,3-dihydroxybenzoate decarboxylase
MFGKVAFEEAFTLPRLEGVCKPTLKHFAVNADDAMDRLLDIDGIRIKEMDEYGVGLQILSHYSPGVQWEKDPVEAQKLAVEVNNYLAE